MPYFYDVARSEEGGIIPAPNVTVYEAGTTTKASIFTDAGLSSAEDNPFEGGSDGLYGFFVAEGLYKIRVEKSGFEAFEVDNVPIGVAVVNEAGGDVDFRVEGDTEANLLFTDASTDRVGIGTGSPGATLDVRGSAVFNEAGGDNDFRVEGDTEPNLLFVDASLDSVSIGVLAALNRISRFTVRTANNNSGTNPNADSDDSGVNVINDDQTAGSFSALRLLNLSPTGVTNSHGEGWVLRSIYRGNNDQDLVLSQVDDAGGSPSNTDRLWILNNGRVGMGATPDADAALDITSTTGGLLVPRMTTTQRDALSSPPDGLIVYNTTTGQFEGRQGGAWVAM